MAMMRPATRYICESCKRKPQTTIPIRSFTNSPATRQDRAASSPASSIAEFLRPKPAIFDSPTKNDRLSNPTKPSPQTPKNNTNNNNREIFELMQTVVDASSRHQNVTSAERQALNAAAKAARNATDLRRRDMSNQWTRAWRDGDIYAPHDLSPAAMRLSSFLRIQKSQKTQPLNSRKNGRADVLDDLGLNPVKEYKNFALLNDFIGDTGRLKHSKETGLRAINQRRVAKAIKRAHGLGLLPHIHRHPELLPEQASYRSGMGIPSLSF